MLVYFEFHESNKSISTFDREMSSEQITALLNSSVISWPFLKQGRNANGQIYESSYNPIANVYLVRIKEID